MASARAKVGLWMLAGALGVAASVLAWRALRPPIPPPPVVDLSQVEERVIAEKIQAYLDSVRVRPRSAEAWGKLAMAYDIHGFERPAVTCYRRAAALARREFRWTYFLAILLSKLEEPDADEWYARSLELRPTYGPLLLKYAQRLYEAGRFDEAARHYRQVIEADSSLSHGYLGLAKVAVSQGDLAAAEQYLEQGLDRSYQHGELHRLLAEVYRRLGDHETAERERIAASQLPLFTPHPDPVFADVVHEGVGSHWAMRRGKAYLMHGNIRAAAEHFREALVHRDDPEAHTKLGITLHRSGQVEEAARHHRAALELQSTSIDAHVNLAAALFELGESEEAMAHLRAAERLDSTSTKPDVTLAAHYVQRGEWRKTFATLEAALRKQPHDIQMTGRLAWMYVTAPEPYRNAQAALRYAARAVDLTGGRESATLMILAEAYVLAGERDRGVETALQARQIAGTAGEQAIAQRIQRRLREWGVVP